MKIGHFEFRRHDVYTIAEIGKNHNGNMDMAKKLIEIAYKCGCHAVKFQGYHTEHLLHKYSESGAEPDIEWLKKCELQPVDFMELKNLCDTLGITFLCTPENEVWVDVLAHSIQVPAFKVSSLNINNYRMLDKIAEKELPVILSTGMSYMDEVDSAMSCFLACDVALLHCVSQYPASVEALNISAMHTMKKKFRCPVGFSDHTKHGIGTKIAVAAGAELVEFHITLDHNLEGPDHAFSLTPTELNKIMTAIYQLRTSLGDGVKQPHKIEGDYVWMKRRCCVAAHTIYRGETIQPQDIICLAPGVNGAIAASEIYKLTSGLYMVAVEVPKGKPILKTDIMRVQCPRK